MSYQAIYDAARQSFDISYALAQAQAAITAVECEHIRPSVLYRPKLSLDGNQWIAIYGDNIQEGVVGCGDSPAAAMLDFDSAWNRKERTAQP